MQVLVRVQQQVQEMASELQLVRQMPGWEQLVPQPVTGSSS